MRKLNKWHVITANVGDSDALLLARKPKRLVQDNDKCKHLSVVCKVVLIDSNLLSCGYGCKIGGFFCLVFE